MDVVRCRNLFLEADSTTYHRQYEALRAIFVEGLPQNRAAEKYGYTHDSMRQLVRRFRAAIHSDSPPPFFNSQRSAAHRRPRLTTHPSH